MFQNKSSRKDICCKKILRECAKVKREAVTVSYDGTSKFLGAPQIKSSSGKDTADAVYNLLVRWNIADRVEAMSFDTTSSNTGALNGACIILQKPQYCRRKLLHLACRHHIYEIVLRQVFEVKLSTSSGPEVQLFERFAKVWKSLDQTAFQNGVEDEIVGSKIPPDEQAAIRNYCNQQLKERHPRNDFREFLQMVAVFLGETLALPATRDGWQKAFIHSKFSFSATISH